MKQELTYHNVDFYPNGKGLKAGAPHFKLEVEEQLKVNDLPTPVKVIYCITFSKLKTQEEYEHFKDKVFELVNNVNPKLTEHISTILFFCLHTYWTFVEVNFDQDYYIDSNNSLRNARPLAELFNHCNTKNLDNTKSSASFNIGGIEFGFSDSKLINWMVDVIKESIKQDSFPYSLGHNMIELRDALINGSQGQLKSLANRKVKEDIIKNSELLTSFCLTIHRVICHFTGVDVRKITTIQMVLYSKLIKEFDMPESDKYTLKDKKSKDAFRKLLIRGMSDMSA